MNQLGTSDRTQNQRQKKMKIKTNKLTEHSLNVTCDDDDDADLEGDRDACDGCTHVRLEPHGDDKDTATEGLLIMVRRMINRVNSEKQ